MSGKVTGWVLENSPATGVGRLVLIVLADHANSDGRNAWPSVPRIAHEARCSQSSVHRVLRELEASGEIVREGIGPHGCVQYRVTMTPPTIGGVRPSEGSDPESATPPTIGPEPSIEPTTSVSATGETSEEPGTELVLLDAQWSRAEGQENGVSLVHNRKKVAATLLQDAVHAVDYFGQATGQRLKPFTASGEKTAALSRVLTAMQDHPEVRTIYRRMIDAALADPWWRGLPGTGVVFGPEKVQEYIQLAEGRRPQAGSGIKLTPSGQALRALRLAADGTA